MAVPGMVSKGTVLSYEDPVTPDTFIEFARQIKLTKPSRTLELIDATHMKSTAKEWLASPIVEWGEVSFTTNYLYADQAEIDTLFGVTKNYKIEAPDGSTLEFAGILKGEDPAESAVNTKEEHSYTIQVTGDVTTTPAA